MGKTTATASIGAALALADKKVVVVDMDIGLRNLDVVMGLENRIVFNIVDVTRGKCKLKQAAIRDRRLENLYLIPASQSDNKQAVSPESMKDLSQELRDEFEYILLDCPAGIERGFENSISAADQAVVVCTPEVSSIRDADRVIGLLYANSISPKLLINRIVPEMVKRGDMLSHQDILEVLSIDLIGLVPMDDQVVIATNTGVPPVLNNNSPAGEAFKRVAQRVMGNIDQPIQVPEAHQNFWQKISRRIGLGK